MGKGDRRTRRGKIRIGTFGNSRRKRPIKDPDAAPNKVKKVTEPKGSKKSTKVKKDIKDKLETKKSKEEVAEKTPKKKKQFQRKLRLSYI